MRIRNLFGIGFGLCLVSAAVLPASAATTAFVGATLIDGTGRAPVPDSVLIVTDGKVAAAGPRASTAIPAGATRIDVTGKTIMPGIVNAHAHVNFDTNGTRTPRQQLADQLALYARYGVTTIQSLGDDGVEDVKLRDELRRDTPDARPGLARLYVAGPVLNARDPADGRANVDANAKRGVDIIKIRLTGPDNAPIRNPAVYGAMIQQAHADHLRFAVHMFTEAEAKGVVDAGADILAHSIRDKEASPALITEIKAKDVGYIPTLTRDLSVFVYESTPAFANDPFFTREPGYAATLARLTTPEAQARLKSNAEAQSIKPALEHARRNLKRMSDAGVSIGLGTDTGAGPERFQGYFEHLELQMMVEAGLTPMQAILAGTGGAAHVLRIEDTVGTLRPGRYADLLVLGANPLTDIRNTHKLEQVWIGGKKVN